MKAKIVLLGSDSRKGQWEINSSVTCHYDTSFCLIFSYNWYRQSFGRQKQCRSKKANSPLVYFDVSGQQKEQVHVHVYQVKKGKLFKKEKYFFVYEKKEPSVLLQLMKIKVQTCYWPVLTFRKKIIAFSCD